MKQITIICDAKIMEDPDLDIRYDLPEFLESQIEGLESGGYDYADAPTIIELYMISEPSLDLNALIDIAKKHERWGRDIGKAIQIIKG